MHGWRGHEEGALMTRKISILGSTGSVGQSTIKVLQAQQKSQVEDYDVQVLSAYNNAKLLADQAIALKAKHAVIGDGTQYERLKSFLNDTDIEVSAGEDALIQAASIPADWIMAAIVGMAGLRPLMAAIKQGTTVAIANKEPLVAAGPLVLEAAKAAGTNILPIDSEHNAVFQVLELENKDSVEKIILTASGGPFRTNTIEEMAQMTPEQALAHPTWNMGAKISIDSATMMNKALEVIEAQRLFDVTSDQIDVLVHPQSLLHSMVQYADGSVLAQMGASDMCTPITNALGWPKRFKTPGERLDISTLTNMSFEPVDHDRFPFVREAYNCLNDSLASCIILNATNEVAVEAFLNHKIAFLDIYNLVLDMLDKCEAKPLHSLKDILSYDSFIRRQANSCILKMTSQSHIDSMAAS
jgi:1-deoxy-D-xylulose-5-phosphate reductoisomerase